MEDLIPELDENEDQGTLVRDAEQPRPKGRRQVSEATLQRIQEFVNTPSRRQSAPPAEQKPKPLGFMGTIKEGAKGTLRALGAAADTYQGDTEEVISAAQAQTAAPKDPDLERFYAHIEEQKQSLGDNPSLWEGIKAVGGAAIDNPRGFGLMVAEQLPNSGVALGAGAAGALAGSFAGPAGAVVGGLAGLAGANIGLETGHKALEAAADGDFPSEERARVLDEGAVKGGVVSIVDAGTLGVTKFITNASRRAVERATIKTLADNGVDVTNAAARRAAMETPEIAEAVKASQELAKQGATTLGKRLAQTGGAVALETIGEGAGEFLGELAATGKANAVDAVIEGFAGLGTSIGEISAVGALNRKGLLRLLGDEKEAQKTAENETKSTGVEHEVIQHPTEPDKFAAVPKVRSVSGIELERDAEGNLKPVAPVSTQADFNLANRPGFQHSAEDKIRERALATIAGRPASDMSNNALIYTIDRGGSRARKIATDEMERRKKEGADPAIANAPEKPADTVSRIITTGREKAQEDGKKAGVILTPAPTANVQGAAPQPAATSMTAANLQVVLPDNTSLPAQWDVVDADSIKATIKEGKNQPRDRSRAASDIQVQGIANNPDYRRLADSPVMDVGAPTISHDGFIVGGNGRFEGVSRAYEQGSATQYLASLKADAAAKGIDPARLDGMKKPVLVRRITQPFDIRKLAIASNSGTGLQYSGLELAKIDAERMQGLENLEITDSGDIALTGSNMANIRHSLGGYSAAELGSLVDKDGSLSQEGVRRIRNAMLYAAYGSNPTLERLVESTDNDLRNISGALVRAAGAAAKARAEIKAGRLPAELDISEQLVGAVETLSKIRSQGQNVDEYLAQIGLFGDEISEDTKAILRVLEANIRSQKKIADFIRTYYDSVSRIDTSTNDIFGAPPPTKPELLKNAKERITEKQPDTKDLFARPTPESRPESPKQPADNASTPKSGEKDQQVKKAEPPKTPKPSPKAEPAKLEPTPETPSLRNHIADLIKRRAASKEPGGKPRTVNSAIERANEVMNGKRPATEIESKWFRTASAALRNSDPKAADILSRISEAIKAQVAPTKAKADNAANEKTEKAKPAVAVRWNQKPVPRGGRILANGIAETIQRNGVAALVGQKITSSERLAELAQVYRNPQYETFRIFFTKRNKIVHASGVTSRLPGSTPIFPKDMDFNQGLKWIKDMMESSGADGYWMLHNHPSGNPTPSNGDMKATAHLASSLPGFKGHVVINSNKYSQITVSRGSLKAAVVTKDFGEDKLLKASKPHEYLGRMIPSTSAVVELGKSFQKEGWVTLIGVSGVSGVRSIAEIPLKTFTTPMLARAAIRRFARKSGAESIFAYGKESDLKAGNAAALTREGFLRSAVNEEGRSHGIGDPIKRSFGRDSGTGGTVVQQDSQSESVDELKNKLIEAKTKFKAGKGSPVKELFRLSNEISDARDNLAAAYDKLPDDSFALQGETFQGKMLFLAKSAQKPGMWQLTRFDAKGEPWGDTQYPTKKQGIEDFLREAEAATVKNVGALELQEDETQSPQTNSPAFKKWFGNSKVVDRAGKPLRVYHGTIKSFDAFDSKADTFHFDHDTGFHYFYKSPRSASEYAEAMGDAYGGDANVMPVYLSMKKPLKITVEGEPSEEWDTSGAKHRKQLREGKYDGAIVRSKISSEVVYVVVSPTQIKSAIGNSGTFDKSGLILNEDQASFNSKAPFRTRIDKITDTLIFNFQDRFKPLKDIQKRAGPVPETEDASLAEERYSGMVRARMDTFEEQMRDPLLKAIHDSGVPFEEVEKYLHALHAPSRNAAMREINPTETELKSQTEALEKQRDSLANDKDVKEFLKERRDLRQAEADIEDGIADESLAVAIKRDIAHLRKNQNVKDYTEALDKLKALRSIKPFQGDNTALSGMSNAEAKATLAKIDANGTRKALEKVSALVDTITSRTREIFVESGLEKADTIDAWNKKYEHYIPLHRDEVSGNTMPKIGQGFNIRGKESKRATGSNKEVTNILAHVVAQHEAAIIRAEKSKVDRALFQFAKTHPDPSLWTLDNAPMLKTVDPTSGLVVERVDPTYKNRDEVLTLKIDGEEHTITFNDQNLEAMRLASSMKNLSAQQLGEVTQLVGKFTRFLATMNTTANPVFVARNFLRDLQTAFVNLSDTEIAAKKKEVFQNIPAAIRGMWNLSRGKGNSQWAKYAQEFKNAGGQTGWMEHYKDIGARADSIKAELAAMGPGKANASRRVLKTWWQTVEDANNAVENGARLAAFVAARKAGLSEGKAASMAKNLTVNFNARGAKGVELNMWYMFMNASIQGTARLIKAMSNRQVRKIVAGVILSGFLMDIMARSMAGDDDDDGENDYDQLPEHTKAMNFVFMMDGQPVTLPMPYGYNFFASAGRKISEMMFRENYSAVKSAVDLTGIFLDAFSPVGQAGSGLQYVAPTVADPLIQWAENKNFAGNPLRKAQNSFGPPKPEYQMGFKSTSAPAKWLAETLNNETGGNEVRPGYVDVNPAMFDFAVSSILGGMGRTYMQSVSGPIKVAGGDDLQAREIPFLNIFVGARPEHQTERKYFEAVENVERATKEITTYRQKGDVDMVRQIREDRKGELRLAEAAKTTKRILTHLRKSDLALDKTNPPNKRELRKKIEERKREVMARFNKRYREATTAE